MIAQARICCKYSIRGGKNFTRTEVRGQKTEGRGQKTKLLELSERAGGGDGVLAVLASPYGICDTAVGYVDNAVAI